MAASKGLSLLAFPVPAGEKPGRARPCKTEMASVCPPNIDESKTSLISLAYIESKTSAFKLSSILSWKTPGTKPPLPRATLAA